MTPQELSSQFEALTNKWEVVGRQIITGERAADHLEFQQTVAADMILITCGIRDLARLIRDYMPITSGQ